MELNVRMNIKANLREADQRIRQINHGAIIAKVSPKPSLIERQSPQRREIYIIKHGGRQRNFELAYIKEF
jgi:hypothetical protein